MSHRSRIPLILARVTVLGPRRETIGSEIGYRSNGTSQLQTRRRETQRVPVRQCKRSCP